MSAARAIPTKPAGGERPVRVLFVTHSYPRWPGDVAGAFVLRLARALADADTDVRVLAPSSPDVPPTDIIEGITVQRFRYAGPARETLAYSGTMAEQVGASLAGKLALFGLLRHARRAARATDASWAPHIVHAHWWFPSGLAVAGALRTPLVLTMHGSDVRLARRSGWAPHLFRRVAARAASITAVSGWLASEARAMMPSLTVQVEPMPVDISLFTAGGARRSAHFLFVGRLNAQKGPALLLDALARSSSGATLDMVGDGPDRQALEARARQLGLEARVTMHGALAQEALVPLYQAAAAVIIPSEEEGLGLVAVEAQLCETPVIAFRSGGLTDVVEHDATGLLVPPGDVSALAAAMDALLARPDRGATLGRAGRTSSLSRFAPRVVAEHYRAIYDRASHVA